MAGIKNIVIIGAGNVGTSLACAFYKAGCNIVQVVGRREEAIKSLSDKFGADHSLSFAEVTKGQDLYLMALPDKAMEEILPQLGLTNELLVHCSGSVPIEILSAYSENTGVFYPLQTFTQNRKIDLQEVPFLIEANRIDNEDALINLGNKLSSNVKVADSVQRQLLHIAAIFASNFSNHMYDIARQLMSENGFDFELLVPLIKETAAKAIDMEPDQAQTGPAIRKDMLVIEKHIELLRDNPEILDIYQRISKNIIDQTD
jgi:predicted short-subunit dehydrogenase-like oxidoreductase (DUF2520 family)